MATSNTRLTVAEIAQGDWLPSQEAAAYTGRPLWYLSRYMEGLDGFADRNSKGHTVAYYPRAKLDALIAEQKELADRKQKGLAGQPVDPDLVFVPEAEELSKCCRPTLYTIARRGDLHRESVRVIDSLGKAHWRPAFHKSEILSLFIQRPEPGKAIHVREGEIYYLREDALQHFNCSNIVLGGYWREKDSRLRHGKALRTRTFYVIVGRAIGCPKRLTGWRGEDLEAIAAGQEGERNWCGRSIAGRPQRKAKREKAETVLQYLKPYLPQLADVALDFVIGQGVSRALAYALKDKAAIVSDYRHEGKRRIGYWMLPGQRVPSAEKVLATIPLPAKLPPSPPHSLPAPSTPTPGNGAPHPQAGGRDGAENRNLGGRNRDPQTAEVYEFCYTEYRIKRQKRSTVLSAAIARFGSSRAPKDKAAVTRYADRHAERLEEQRTNAGG